MTPIENEGYLGQGPLKAEPQPAKGNVIQHLVFEGRREDRPAGHLMEWLRGRIEIVLDARRHNNQGEWVRRAEGDVAGFGLEIISHGVITSYSERVAPVIDLSNQINQVLAGPEPVTEPVRSILERVKPIMGGIIQAGKFEYEQAEVALKTAGRELPYKVQVNDYGLGLQHSLAVLACLDGRVLKRVRATGKSVFVDEIDWFGEGDSQRYPRKYILGRKTEGDKLFFEDAFPFNQKTRDGKKLKQVKLEVKWPKRKIE